MGPTKKRAPAPDRSAAGPVLGIRFESRDDFLVEYTDHLRHGVLQVGFGEALDDGSGVRIRLTLPDETHLFLTGVVKTGSGPTRVDLDPLKPEQRAAMERCARAVADRQGSTADGSAEVEAEPITVLLVDDSVSQRIEVGDALRARGCRVRVAENGLLALSQALKKMPDVILTDVEMPQMDGWALLRAVRARKRLASVPFVFLTHLSDELSRLRGYRLGADDFLPKTMAPEEIIGRLHGVILRRRQMPPGEPSGSGLRGELRHVSLGSLFSFLEAERRSGFLTLRDGSEEVVLTIRAGALASVDDLGRFVRPEDRVFELLDWSRGSFEFSPGDGAQRGVAAGVAPTDVSLSYLLMEHARREDEADR